ncbi:phosphatases II [Thozetella sp. PMI_491]|nr:phosphatases II [Thozetella sp. PMI_491]
MDSPTPLREPEKRLPSQVSEQLFVGSVENARDAAILSKLGITHLVNAAHEFNHSWRGRPCYMHVPLYDRTSERATLFFEQVWVFIDKAKEDESAKVMVFCQHGISRSVTLALSYMIKSEKLTLGEAFAKLRAARTEAEPNHGFLRELRQLEQRLYGQVTTTELLTRFDRGADPVDSGADHTFRESVATFVAGGDGRVNESVSQVALEHILGAAERLGPSGVQEVMLPLVCETFTHFGGRTTRDEGARNFLQRALDVVTAMGPAYADAISKGLKHVHEEDEFQSMAEDVPLAPRFLKTLRRL